MKHQEIKQFDLKALVKNVVYRPAPNSCEEIAQLLSNLPLWSSFINTSPKPEQKKAYALLKEKSVAFTKEEILFMAEICCGKYHRIRKDGDFRNFDSNEAKNFYKQYYDMTGSEEVKYILENFDEFKELCLKSVLERQRDDDFAPYREDSKLSTSRDPDSEEWKGKR